MWHNSHTITILQGWRWKELRVPCSSPKLLKEASTKWYCRKCMILMLIFSVDDDFSKLLLQDGKTIV
jgi:hypothetical protein